MEGYNKLNSKNHPPHNSVVTLTDGQRTIQAEFHIENEQMSYTWIPRHFEKGICMMGSPTHWK